MHSCKTFRWVFTLDSNGIRSTFILFYNSEFSSESECLNQPCSDPVLKDCVPPDTTNEVTGNVVLPVREVNWVFSWKYNKIRQECCWVPIHWQGHTVHPLTLDLHSPLTGSRVHVVHLSLDVGSGQTRGHKGDIGVWYRKVSHGTFVTKSWRQ